MNTNFKFLIEKSQNGILELEKDLTTKMNNEEGANIWANFSKFAVYDDLKDLYTRCIPAIAGQEDKLKKVRDELAKM